MKQPPPGKNKGQITAVEDETDRFMNTALLHPGFLGYLKAKYGCDYVLFVNEMDLDNDLGMDPYNYGGKEEYQRSAVVHWTMFDASNSTRIAAGKVKANFPNTSNTTKKIIDGPFKTLTAAIY